MDCYDVSSQFADASEGQIATKGKLCLLCVVFYVLLGWCCWTELRYRSSVELPAQFSVIGKVIRGSRHESREMRCLRYTFQDPVTGQRRQNTVEVPPSQVPAGQRVLIQYLSGEYPQSRLVIQAKPWMVNVFYSFTAMLILTGVAGLVGLSREVHAQPHRRVQSFTPARRRIEIT